MVPDELEELPIELLVEADVEADVELVVDAAVEPEVDVELPIDPVEAALVVEREVAPLLLAWLPELDAEPLLVELPLDPLDPDELVPLVLLLDPVGAVDELHAQRVTATRTKSV